MEVPPDDWTYWRPENMGIKLTGKLEPCEICAQVKKRQANIPKKKE